jgi:hypothetical protein
MKAKIQIRIILTIFAEFIFRQAYHKVCHPVSVSIEIMIGSEDQLLAFQIVDAMSITEHNGLVQSSRVCFLRNNNRFLNPNFYVPTY